MKKTIKILLICILTILVLQSTILASGSIDTDIEIGGTSEIHASDNMIRRIVGSMQVIGSVISVIALIIIGYRYMFSSIEEQAKVKGVLIYYLIGAALVFATPAVLGIIYNIIN